MRVTMSMLHDILAEQYAVTIGEAFDPHATVSMAFEFGNPTLQVKTDMVCVMSVEDYATNIEETLYRAERTVLVRRSDGPSSYSCSLCVTADKSPDYLVSHIEEGLCRYKRTLWQMSDMVFDGADIQDVVECSHALLGNPVIVQDRAMRVRARTLSDPMEDEMWTPLDSRVASFSMPGIPDGFQDFVEELEAKRELLDYEVFNGEKLFACRTKEIAGNYLMVILLQKNHPVTDGDIDVLRSLCYLVELSMKTSTGQYKEVIGYNGLLIDALEGRIINPVEFRNRMEALGHVIKPIARIMIAAPQKGRLNDRQASRLINDILNTFPFGRGVCYDGRLVFFASYDSAGQVCSTDFERFEQFLQNYKMIAALSEPRLLDCPVRNLYESAVLTLDVGRRVYPDRPLYFFEDCHPFWVYETCLKSGDADLYIHPALDTLRSYDLRNQSSLYKVLQLLARNRGNRSQTAKDLFIQRNTLQARIKEIELICKIDLSDSTEIDHIRRSFILDDYTRAAYSPIRLGGLK